MEWWLQEIEGLENREDKKNVEGWLPRAGEGSMVSYFLLVQISVLKDGESSGDGCW